MADHQGLDESFVKNKLVGFGGLGFVVEDQGAAKHFRVLYQDVLVTRPPFMVYPVNAFTLDNTWRDIFEVPTFIWSSCRLVQTVSLRWLPVEWMKYLGCVRALFP